MAFQIIPTAKLKGLNAQEVADAMNAKRVDCYATVVETGIQCRGRESEQIGYGVIADLDRKAHGIVQVRWARVPVEQEIRRGKRAGGTRVVEEWGVTGVGLTVGQVVDAVRRGGETTRVTVTQIVATQGGQDLATVKR